jgi:hypothetical protein
VSAPQLGGEGGGQAVLQALETLSEPQRVGESEPGLQVQVEALLQPGRQGGRVKAHLYTTYFLYFYAYITLLKKKRQLSAYTTV